MKNIFAGLMIMMFINILMAQEDYGKVSIHGFVSQGYMQSSANNYFGETADGTFEFNELGINFSTELTDQLRVGAQLFARDLGYLGNDELIVDWAYGDYRYKNWIGFRGGKMKMPLGLYNEYRDLDMARVNIFMPQGVYNETWRDSFNAIKGIGIYGTINTGVLGIFNYQLQAGVLNINAKTGVNKYIEDQLYAELSDYKLKNAYTASLVWDTPITGLRLAGSIMKTDFSAFGITEDVEFWREKTLEAAQGVMYKFYKEHNPELTDEEIFALLPTTYEEATEVLDLVNTEIQQEFKDIFAFWLSAEYVYNNLTLAAEYYKLRTDYRTTSPSYGDLRPWAENELGGYYGSAAYRFNDHFEVGTYYSEYYPDLSDKDGKGYQIVYDFPASNGYLKDLAVSLRFDINPYWIIKLEGHKFNGTAVMFRSDQKDPNKVKKDWNLFAAKLTYNF